MNVYEKAKLFAIEAHTSIGQVRKFDGSPYHTHVLRVAELVETRNPDQEVLAAACLHDVLEDVEPKNPDFGRDTILREFGPRVLDLVLEIMTGIYDITLNDGTLLAGYTLYEGDIGAKSGTITVGYDGHLEDPTLPEDMIGVRRIINLADVREINPVG